MIEMMVLLQISLLILSEFKQILFYLKSLKTVGIVLVLEGIEVN